ncbi:MAG: beta-galactosidase [Lentisphaerae bacterium]|nr:beta-galactosidase [Lentisphaerota bacterium]
MNTPRPEYPRPQFVRDEWLCLNGEWEFEVDAGDTGLERGLTNHPLADRILVPFCPESKLSGIGNTDFLNAVWYRRAVTVPAAWAGKQVMLNFQAVDDDATVWVNGTEAGRHRGGATPFSVPLPDAAAGKEVTIVVRARDDHRELKHKGKQSPRFGNYGCLYTRTTGIWQTVWLEPVAKTHMGRPKILPDLPGKSFHITVPLRNARAGQKLCATLKSEGRAIASAGAAAGNGFGVALTLSIPEGEVRLWEPGAGRLYDIELDLLDADGSLLDRARSYAGLRSVGIDGMAVLINGKRVFQRLVLDQGYYPDGILTAPSDEALRRDIELSAAAGFNGARLHQKVFEERFLYHADRMGYMVWGEFPDWAIASAGRPGVAPNQAAVLAQWSEALERDVSHPAIVGWCPLNETNSKVSDSIAVHDDLMRAMFLAAKQADPTRPVLDASGYAHRVPEADVYDSHDYDQDPAAFRERHAGLGEGKPYVNTSPDFDSIPWRGQPYFVSEFGGIWWNPDVRPDESSWGYGQRPKNPDEFYARFEGLCAALLDNPHMFGYCYTQLTDVFQEQNGIYRFDRRAKFDMARIRAAQTRAAAMEQQG